MADDEHKPPAEESEFINWRSSNYRDSCSEGYMPGGTRPGTNKPLWNAHHILICASLKDANIKPTSARPYIKECFKLTNWDVNKSANLIGLDVKWPYLLNKDDPKKYPLPDNLPCHRVGHPAYNQQVYTYMEQNVWGELQANKKDHPKGRDIANELDNASKHFKRFLIKRGGDLGGTLHCWEHRHDLDKKGIPWFVPFSMAPIPKPRAPGPDPDKLKAYKDMFNAIT